MGPVEELSVAASIVTVVGVIFGVVAVVIAWFTLRSQRAADVQGRVRERVELVLQQANVLEPAIRDNSVVIAAATAIVEELRSRMELPNAEGARRLMANDLSAQSIAVVGWSSATLSRHLMERLDTLALAASALRGDFRLYYITTVLIDLFVGQIVNTFARWLIAQRNMTVEGDEWDELRAAMTIALQQYVAESSEMQALLTAVHHCLDLIHESAVAMRDVNDDRIMSHWVAKEDRTTEPFIIELKRLTMRWEHVLPSEAYRRIEKLPNAINYSISGQHLPDKLES